MAMECYQPQSQSPGSLSGRSLAQSIDSPNNKRLNSQQVNSTITGGSIAGGANMQGTQERLTLMSPQRQSTQYNILSQRLAELSNPQFTQIQGTVAAQSRVNQALANDARNGSQNGGAPSTQPATGAGPGGFEAVPPPAGPNVEPLKIESLADGISAKGLHDLLSDAEKLMKADKFESAIQKYNDRTARCAEQRPGSPGPGERGAGRGLLLPGQCRPSPGFPG